MEEVSLAAPAMTEVADEAFRSSLAPDSTEERSFLKPRCRKAFRDVRP